MPDLTGQWVSAVSTCTESTKGIKCTLKATLNIQNIGTADSSSCVVKYYLSDDNILDLDGGDTFLKQVSIGKISAGTSITKNLSYSFPYGVSIAGKYIIAVIDADDAVEESDEDNNIAYGLIL